MLGTLAPTERVTWLQFDLPMMRRGALLHWSLADNLMERQVGHSALQSALHSALHGALHGAVHGALHKCTCEEVVRVDAPREIGDAALPGIYTVAAWGTTVAGALAFGCRPGADQEARCRIGGQV